ncbi:hypothetical protein NQK81_12605 [Amycolatopsis roodepoortensis]|uniref:hypothetical protein n=1 Tax=Amycolatopsis roodepoortensis TaxID=700274 RepID=UPI00214CF360|nr:hypothetical protein [Amycolatopsis roodepoortensis]UUV34246.1 hypothetical protein NQK81_12605 [Amycolatopsis roodepoortensis]
MEDRRLETHPDLMDPDWREHAEVDAWLGAKKDLKKRRKQASRRGFRVSGGPVLVLALIALVVAAVVVHRVQGRGVNDVPGFGQPPKAAPVSGGVDLNRPYDRTPAAYWREGIAGIVVPPGNAVGGFTAEEVDAAYRTVTEAIAAARLGSRALQNADGSELLRLLTPNERVRLEPVLTSRLKVEKGKYLTLIGPHRLLQVSPRMTGFLTSKAGEKGELVVHASYTTAYAFDAHPGEARSPSDIVPFVRDEQDYVIRKAPPFAEADAGLSFGEGAGYHSRMACDALKAGILAPQYSDKSKPVDGALAVDEVDTYDPTKPLPSTGNCG